MDWKKMELSITSKRLLRIAGLLLLLVPSSYAFALTDYLQGQSTDQLVIILYFLLGVLSILLIMPIVQFYLADTKNKSFNESLEQKQNILDSLHCGILYVEPSGKVHYANDAALKFLGRERHEVLNSDFVINFDDTDANKLKKALDSADENAQNSISALVKANDLHVKLCFTDNTEQDEKTLRVVTLNEPSISSSYSQQYNELAGITLNESSAEGAGDFSDVNSLEEIKALLNQKHIELNTVSERLDTFLALSPVAVATINSDYQIKNSNVAMQSCLQLDEAGLEGRSIFALFEEADLAEAAMANLQQKGHLHGVHVKLKGKHEHTLPFELTIESINENNTDYILWLVDRSAEEFQRVKFENLLSHSAMPMAILEENGFCQLNQAACKFFDVENQTELLGASPDSLKINVDKKHAKKLRSTIAKVKLEGKVKNLPWTHLIGDKSIPCEITLVPIFKNKVLSFVVCMWADLSEIKKLSDSISQVNAISRFVDAELAAKRTLIIDTREELENKVSALNTTESKLNEVEDDLVNTKTEFTQVQKEYEQVNETLRALEEKFQAGRSDLDGSERVNTELNQQLEQVSNEVSELREQRQKIVDEVESTKEKYEAAQEALDSSEKTAERLTEEKQKQEDSLKTLLAEVETMREEVKKKDEHLATVNTQIENLETELNSAKESEGALKKQLETQQSTTEQAQQQHLLLEERDKQVQQDLQTKADELRKLEEALEKLEKQAKQEKQDMESIQSSLKDDLSSTLSKLSESQSALDSFKAFAEQEGLEKSDHKTTIDRYVEELRVYKAASKEQEKAISQNDENWKKQRSEIETQKETLQQSLAKTQEQNEKLQSQLEQQSEALQRAEVSLQTNEKEQKHLQDKLDSAQSDLSRLQKDLKVKEQEEQSLKQQLKSQQKSISSQEQSVIEDNQEKQKELAVKLAAVEAQYEESKLSVDKQQLDFDTLQSQLLSLEGSLSNSDKKLAEKSEALKQAEQELEASKKRLMEREATLLTKHKEELELLSQQNTSATPKRPEIEQLPMPARPEIWFDLVDYLRNNSLSAPLPEALNQLMDDVELNVKQAEISINKNDLVGIRTHSSKLLQLANTINSDALKELMQSVENDCRDGMILNVSIRWPAVKAAFQRSLRSLYSYLHG